MTFSKIGRILTALVASAALGLGMTACGGGTIGYLWVLGTYYNQISGFKIDDYTGNLTAILHSPFNSGGSNPQMLLVKPGGRFVYVLNSGTGSTFTGASIAEFSVGGSGTLTFQNNYYPQGSGPLYMAFDTSGNYLYVLTAQSPDYSTSNPIGAITAYSIASDTGELTLVPNTGVLKGQLPTYYFNVGQNPVMVKVGSGNCLYTLSPTSIFSDVISSSTGTLTEAATGPYQVTNATKLTSINTSNSGSYTFLTDGGSNQIYTLTGGGTTCSFQSVSGSQETNIAPNVIPVNSVTSQNGKYLYVINQGIPNSTGTTPAGSISGYSILSTGILQEISDVPNNPYPTGAGPVCIVEDPSNQYLYISNNIDSTITGKVLNTSYGYLSDLSHGSAFPTTTNPTCLAVSGNL